MYKRLLVPVDGSRCSEDAARAALDLARRTGAGVVFAHVVTAPRSHARRALEAEERVLACAEALLERWLNEARRDGVPAESRLREGRDVAATLSDLAEAEGCNLVLIGTHGRHGAERALLGSVAERVARLAPVPVMLVRPSDRAAAPAAVAASAGKELGSRV